MKLRTSVFSSSLQWQFLLGITDAGSLHPRVELGFLTCSIQNAASTSAHAWNKLHWHEFPSDIVESPSLDPFKSCLYLVPGNGLVEFEPEFGPDDLPRSFPASPSLCFCEMGNGLVHLGWMASDCHWSGSCGDVTSNTSKLSMHKSNQKGPDCWSDNCQRLEAEGNFRALSEGWRSGSIFLLLFNNCKSPLLDVYAICSLQTGAHAHIPQLNPGAFWDSKSLLCINWPPKAVGKMNKSPIKTRQVNFAAALLKIKSLRNLIW